MLYLHACACANFSGQTTTFRQLGQKLAYFSRFENQKSQVQQLSPQKPPYPRISGSEGCCPLKVLFRGENVMPAGFQALKVNFRGTCAEFRALGPLKIC